MMCCAPKADIICVLNIATDALSQHFASFAPSMKAGDCPDHVTIFLAGDAHDADTSSPGGSSWMMYICLLYCGVREAASTCTRAGESLWAGVLLLCDDDATFSYDATFSNEATITLFFIHASADTSRARCSTA
jgi:hypothetical protein